MKKIGALLFSIMFCMSALIFASDSANQVFDIPSISGISINGRGRRRDTGRTYWQRGGTSKDHKVFR